MTEEWRWLDGWEGYYRISDRGKVMTVGNVQVHPYHGKVFARKPKYLKGRPDKKGYLSVALCRHATQEQHRVHRLVLQTFGSPPPNEKYHCHHKNFCKTDNCISNLEWLSPSEHAKLSWRMGRLKLTRPRGEQCHQSILTAKQVITIRNFFDAGLYTKAMLGRMFGTSWSNINRIIKRETWKHVP